MTNEEYKGKILKHTKHLEELFGGRVVSFTGVILEDKENTTISMVNLSSYFKGDVFDFIDLLLNIVSKINDTIREHCPNDEDFQKLIALKLMEETLATIKYLNQEGVDNGRPSSENG